jgi:hypothetical protein
MPTTNRYSSAAFGGGEQGELRAYEALVAHEATLVVGAQVQAYRRSTAKGTIVGTDGAHKVVVEESDGFRVIVDTRDLELTP